MNKLRVESGTVRHGRVYGGMRGWYGGGCPGVKMDGVQGTCNYPPFNGSETVQVPSYGKLTIRYVGT